MGSPPCQCHVLKSQMCQLFQKNQDSCSQSFGGISLRFKLIVHSLCLTISCLFVYELVTELPCLGWKNMDNHKMAKQYRKKSPRFLHLRYSSPNHFKLLVFSFSIALFSLTQVNFQDLCTLVFVDSQLPSQPFLPKTKACSCKQIDIISHISLKKLFKIIRYSIHNGKGNTLCQTIDSVCKH